VEVEPAIRKRHWKRWLVLCLVALALYGTIPGLMNSMRLAVLVRQVASGDTGAGRNIREEKISRRMHGSEYQAVAYQPLNALPSKAVLLVPGVSELGCYHPRLVALARILADAGFLVLTPDIKMLRDFQIYPPPLDEISLWIHEIHGAAGGEKLRSVGLAGVSFSATLALIAAAQPQNRDQVSYILGIGAFDDLLRCSRFSFSAGPVTVGEGYYPTRFYAKWIIMLAALDLAPSAGERQFLETVLRSLLIQKEIPPLPATVSETGKRWYRLALMREDQEDPELARQILDHVAAKLNPELSTRKPAAEIRCPVFLAHGAYDDLIPCTESAELRAKILNAKSYLLISPLLTHTHPVEQPLGWWTKARAAVDVLFFFYRLAGEM
jgi:pimeloyl-ACP methyl ester carboxylesterase